ATPAERTERAVSLMSTLAGRRLRVDERTFESEMANADRNLALGHMLRSHGILQDRAEDVVAGYIAQCSVMVNVRDLAVMGATLASGGIHPLTGDRVLSSLVCRQVLSVMSSAGMYDAAGQWMAHVGIPAKSGVSGAVLGALPGQVGIGTYSPRLDPFGNSVRGVEMCRIMSEDLDLHIMEADAIGSTVVRSVRREGDTVHLHLQGVIRFGGGESVLAAMTELGTGADPDPVDWAHCFYPFSEEPDTAAGRAAAQDEG
ncbi:glutaminase A, partial [Micrococcus endophyticus]